MRLMLIAIATLFAIMFADNTNNSNNIKAVAPQFFNAPFYYHEEHASPNGGIVCYRVPVNVRCLTTDENGNVYELLRK